ncbi:MAG: 16S rRNA (guanine(527)-N(7))-methyltransferase RsmG [Propionibacteriaceae bacterium]|nr:16S rRNA (guanine(527)-N(7))-methyltransferase RsmG [Propionibacteriaceae bacterium]
MTGDVPQAVLDEVFGERAGRVVQYHDILATRGIEWGLLGPREADRLWSRHIMNSAAIAVFVPQDASVVDVGSGAGLPGIPLALTRPDLRIWLLDSLLRRVNFLELAVDELGLADRVKVLRSRAEQCSERFDVVVARAVAPLTKLVEWCEPMMGRSMVALKGDSAETEVAEAESVLKSRHLMATVRRVDDGLGGEATAVVVVRE